MDIKSNRLTQEHPYNLKKAIERFEKGYLHNILQLNKGNKDKASKMLGICFDDLERKIRKYQIYF